MASYSSFSFSTTIRSLQEIGVFDVLLPFLLIFSILFAILEKTKVLGSDKTNINIVVSTVIALLVIVQKGIVETINLFLPRVSLIIVVILMGLLTMSLVAGKEFKGLKGGLFSIAVVIIIIAIIISLTGSDFGFNLSQRDRESLLNIGLPLIVFLLVIFLVTRTSKPNHPPLLNKLNELIHGGFEK